MQGAHLLFVGEVGDGACHFEDTAVGAGGEAQALHGFTKQVEALIVGFGIFVDHLLRHLCVAVDARHVLVSFRLYGACGDDAFADLL